MRIYALILALVFAGAARAAERGFAESSNATNTSLLVSVSHGLSGLDYDIANVQAMTNNPIYHFGTRIIKEEQANVADVAAGLTDGIKAADKAGTFLFYFTGHGGMGTIWPQDTTMTVQQIRQALEAGRDGIGPVKRLVLIYDSCHAGSMMDPMRALQFGPVADAHTMSQLFVNAVVDGLQPSRETPYWEKLMVIASSQADETSLASPSGSIFTLAFKKAYDEAIQKNTTVGEFIALSQQYTVGHHPVARLVPDSLKDEKMIP